MKFADEFVKSWRSTVGNVNTTKEILDWVDYRNRTVKVSIKKTKPEPDGFWYYDKGAGRILNRKRTFFQIAGLKHYVNGELRSEQPVILQPEIGYLGIMCKIIDGTLNFLMQAKIEPGNVNKIQISPTIQATKSNFTQAHGGTKPPYLDYFLNAEKYDIIVDQIESEQSSRFYHKRNRNIIILVNDDVEVLPSHKWMTLGQIKDLMKYENLVNMDTRTVLSMIPYSLSEYTDKQLSELENVFCDKALFRSVFCPGESNITAMFRKLNNRKMFCEDSVKITRLDELDSWSMKNGELVCENEREFKVVFCDITMEGREVKQWTQPLFEAIGMAFFGLFTCVDNGVRKFLIRVKPELGCFDVAEFGPSVQLEPTNPIEKCDTAVESLFYTKLKSGEGVLYNTVLSEEGGRFYHEQNHNVIIEISKDELPCPEDGVWVSYKDINTVMQVNNAVNIQLRNLLALLEA